ncbi:MAG: alanine racemase [Oscillospiraceae bacterium]
MREEKRAWAEISLDAIEHNMCEIRRHVGDEVKILGIVKADAYGHGYLEVSKTILDSGADYLAVACIDEAVQLRLCGINAPILILGATVDDDAFEIVNRNIIPTCFSYDRAKCISDVAKQCGKTAKIHIKIDTGMSRVGFRYTENKKINDNTLTEIIRISKLPNLQIDGIFTHFSVADDDDDDYTMLQFRRFSEVCEKLKLCGIDIPLRHCCNSAALMRFPNMHMDMVRPGIIQYGLMPSEFVDKDILDLRPAMQLKACITHIKTLESGVSISYGRRFKTKKISQIATIPIGYADGFSRILSGKAEVIINNQKCKIVGNICMDQCMIDVTSVNNVSIGDDVILFGSCDNIEIPVESIAEKMGTINYEILCVIGKRIPRIYLKDGQVDEVHNYLLDPPISE